MTPHPVPLCSSLAFHGEWELASRILHVTQETLAISHLVAAMVSLTCETVKTPNSKLHCIFIADCFRVARTLVTCAIWHHTCLRRGPCQILRLQQPRSSETQEFCTAILDTFDKRTQAEAVNRFLASRNSCRTGHATQRMFVVCTVHLFQMELHPTRTDCSLAFCSFCSSVVVTLERSSGTSGTRAVFETETRNNRVFSVLLSARWRDWRCSVFSTSSLGARLMCPSADHLRVHTGHFHKFVLTVQHPFRRQ